jgi:hypothetical protein
MARADTPTLLSLDDFAKVMGINPAHFNGAAGVDTMPIVDNACNDLWPQDAWQAGDRVSRDELAQEIANAEQDIADYLNYWPAPVWVAQENHPYPRHHRPDVIRAGGYDVRGYRIGINTNYGYVIAPGQRATSLVGDSVAVVLSDADGDGYDETATVTTATTLTDECEVKVYFEDKGAAQEWEIRPARTRTIAGGNFIATFWTWQLIDPDLWDALPTVEGQSAINWTVAANIVDNVDVYREYNDTTTQSALFYWEPRTQPLDWAANLNCGCGSSSCAACALTTQSGCLHVRNPVTGIVVPQPATYDDDDAAWGADCWTECRDPDIVQLWYYAGQYDDRWRRSEACEPLSRWWQQTIAWMATARLERPFCSCKNLTALAERLRADVAALSEQQSFAVSTEELANPFGTRVGEILAWRRVSKLVKKRPGVAVM